MLIPFTKAWKTARQEELDNLIIVLTALNKDWRFDEFSRIAFRGALMDAKNFERLSVGQRLDIASLAMEYHGALVKCMLVRSVAANDLFRQARMTGDLKEKIAILNKVSKLGE
jgi:hypothetical protein